MGRGLLGRPTGCAGWAKQTTRASGPEGRRGERAGRADWLGLLMPVGPRGEVLGWAPAAYWADAGKEKEGEERECWAGPRHEGREERRE